MRILHLSTSDAGGGAAKAAYRLHEALLAAGEDSAMLVRTKTSSSGTLTSAPPADPAQEFFGKVIQSRYIDHNRTSISTTHFSLGWPGINLADDPLVRAADILHLHWVSGFLAPASISRLQTLGKPMVWTLHDQRPYTGGCHFSAGCEKYRVDCAGCPQLRDDPYVLTKVNLGDQLSLLQTAAIAVVAPSRWMSMCARQSAVFRNSCVEVIPYGIDTRVFCPRDRAQSRREFGLPPDAICLLFGADFGQERRKGFSQLLEALALCQGDPGFAERLRSGEIVLATFGRGGTQLAPPGIPLRDLGYLGADERLAKAYSAAELFVLPSLEDNLPNTAMESISCGTPVVAFAAGGVPDLVVDGVTGSLAAVGDTRQLSAAILSLISDTAKRESLARTCREYAQERFGQETQAKKARALYGQLLDAHQAHRPVHPRQIQPEFHALFPTLCSHVFRGPAKNLPKPVRARGLKASWLRWIFHRRVTRILARAGETGASWAELWKRLGAESAVMQGERPLSQYLRLLFGARG